jgi:polyisoprenoid-binding protein YceI
MSRLRFLFFLAYCCKFATGNAAVFQVDSTNSTAYFEVGYLGHGMVKGALNHISGKVDLDGASKTGSADINFDMTTVETGHRMTNHFIKSHSIFNIEAYPAMLFHATSFDFDGERLLAVNGDLNLHGVTRMIRLEAKRFSCADSVNADTLRQQCNGEFSTTIYRSNFGMNSFSFMVNDEVMINVSLALDRILP